MSAKQDKERAEPAPPAGDGPPGALLAAVEAARARKAVDLKVLDLREVAEFTDFFVLLSGTSSRQVQAIVEAVEERLRGMGLKPTHAEGVSQAEWVLLDYSDFVVHVFSPLKREFYDLDRLWRDAREVEVPEAA